MDNGSFNHIITTTHDQLIKSYPQNSLIHAERVSLSALTITLVPLSGKFLTGKVDKFITKHHNSNFAAGKECLHKFLHYIYMCEHMCSCKTWQLDSKMGYFELLRLIFFLSRPHCNKIPLCHTGTNPKP